MIELPLDTQAALIALSHLPTRPAPELPFPSTLRSKKKRRWGRHYFWRSQYRYDERDISAICDCAACTYHWRHNAENNPDRYHLRVL